MSADAQTWVRLHRQLLTALPVRGLCDLLGNLAEMWLELTNARAALVSQCAAHDERLLGSWAETGRPTRSFQLDVQAPQSWSANHVLRVLGGQGGFDDISSLHSEVVPFSNQGGPTGGAILFVESAKSLQTPLLPEMTSLSEKLVEQAMIQDRSSGDEGTQLEAAKLESLAELAAGAGHEINNPLATISGRVQLLLREETDPNRRQALSTIGGQAFRIRDMIGDLMLFARPPQTHPESIKLADVLDEVLSGLQERAGSQNCTFDAEADPSVTVWADRGQLCVVISSVICNSLDALIGGGPIDISVRSTAEGRFALLSVADQGPGLSETDRRHLFDPFYSGRQAGRGLGFGLSKCWRIVSNHQGRIEVESLPGKKTTFKVYWPQDASPVE
jgi:signal transduction histidine kinase